MKYTETSVNTENTKSLLVIGSLIQSNDIEKVLTTLSRVLQKHEVQLVVAGPVNALPKWVTEIENRGLERNVIFRPARNAEELAERYLDCSMFLDISDSSKSTMELHGVAVLEAMRFQKPVITTWQLEHDGLVEHGKTAIVVKSHRPIEVAASISFLLGNDRMTAELGKRGFTYVMNLFDFSTLSVRASEAYHDVTKFVNLKVA